MTPGSPESRPLTPPARLSRTPPSSASKRPSESHAPHSAKRPHGEVPGTAQKAVKTPQKPIFFGGGLPTPQKSGSVRKTRVLPVPFAGKKAVSVADRLKALSEQETLEFVPRTEVSPQTPRKNIITDEMAAQWHLQDGKDDPGVSDEESSVSTSSLAISNPFVRGDSPEFGGKRGSAISGSFLAVSNPFISKQDPFLANPFGITIPPTKPVDYSTHNEFHNSRTKETIIRELTDHEKLFKPKKLDFSAAQPVKVNNNIQNFQNAHSPKLLDEKIGKKFMLKNLNEFMVDGKPKNSLGFEIFKDLEK